MNGGQGRETGDRETKTENPRVDRDAGRQRDGHTHTHQRRQKKKSERNRQETAPGDPMAERERERDRRPESRRAAEKGQLRGSQGGQARLNHRSVLAPH